MFLRTENSSARFKPMLLELYIFYRVFFLSFWLFLLIFFYWQVKFFYDEYGERDYFSSILSNQLTTPIVLLHSLSYSFSHKLVLVLNNINFLFLVGFSILVLEWLTKLFLWSFKVIKQLLVQIFILY